MGTLRRKKSQEGQKRNDMLKLIAGNDNNIKEQAEAELEGHRAMHHRYEAAVRLIEI